MRYAIFIVERKLIKWNQIVKRKMTNKRKNIAILFLWMGTFLNPLGFAELAAIIMKTTGWDYWTTMHLFYVLAVAFYVVSFYLFKLNPIRFARDKVKKIFKKKV